jgi:tetratricopeptide (TPR) repeat protein
MCLLVAAAGVIAGVVVWRAWTAAADSSEQAEEHLAIPTVDLVGCDPEVATAIKSAQAAVRRNPKSARAWGRLGMVLAAHDWRPAAADCFVRAEQLDRADAHWPYYQAILAPERDPQQIRECLERAAAVASPDARFVRAALADTLLENSALEPAQTQFQKLLSARPGDARANLGLARIALLRGEPAAARERLQACLHDPHTQRKAEELLGQAALSSGDHRAARDAIERAALLPPDKPWSDPYLQEVLSLKTGLAGYLELAGKYFAEGRGAESVGLLQQAVREYPAAAEPRLWLGRALLNSDDPRAARQELLAAQTRAPSSFDAHFYLGVAEFQLRDYAAAATEFRAAAKLKPDAKTLLNLGQALGHSGDSEGAIGALREAIRLDPDYAKAHLELAVLLGDRRQWAEAIAEATAAIDAHSDDPRAPELLRRLKSLAAGESGQPKP